MIIMGDRKKQLTAILGPDSPNVGIKGDGQGPEAPEGAEDQALDATVSELIECFHSKDVEGVREGLRAIFQAFESEPHNEGPHLE